MIEGVVLHPLRQFVDERGRTMQMLRNDDPHFRAFGEIYFSGVQHGRVKGWYRHREKTLNYAVPVGMVRVVIFDDRAASATHGQLAEFLLGEQPDQYALLTIPPQVWYGMQGLAPGTSIVANCADMPNDPGESDRKPPDSPDVPYAWPAVG
jgi:dTDP-4-dehydrorhamnose 3,5-epimerase